MRHDDRYVADHEKDNRASLNGERIFVPPLILHNLRNVRYAIRCTSADCAHPSTVRSNRRTSVKMALDSDAHPVVRPVHGAR